MAIHKQLILISIPLFLSYFAQAQIPVQASFTMSASSGCPPLTVQFTNTTTDGISGIYQWDFGDGDTSSAFSPMHTYLSGGDFTVTLYGTSSSGFPFLPAMDSVTVASVSLSVFPEICLVTVDSTSTVNILVWQKPTDPVIAAANIYRESDTNWVLVGAIPQTSLSKFVDQNVVPNDSSYSYKIAFLDTCGNESPISGVHTTMHLTAYTVPPYPEVHLTWVNYTGFNFSASRVLRDTTGTGDFELLDSLSSGVVSYIDSNPPANSVYVIEIIHPEGCVASKSAENHNTSRSNRSIPMANPGGKVTEHGIGDTGFRIFPNPNNGKFTIEISNSRLQISNLQIYNILGEIVYSSIISESKTEINLGRQVSGMYYLQVQTEQMEFLQIKRKFYLCR